MIYGTAFFLSVVAAIGVISSTLCAPALPLITDYFGVKISEIQFTMSLFLMGNAFGQLVSGPLSDRFGRRRVLMGALVIYTLASLGAGSAISMGMLIASRFLQGMGSAVGPVLARAIAASRFSPKISAKVQSYGAIGVGLASIIAMLFSGQLTMFSWRGNFFLAAAFGLMLLLWTLWVLRDEERKYDGFSLKEMLLEWKRLATHPGFLKPTLCHAMTYGLMYGYIALFPFFVFQLFHQKSPQLIALYSAGMIGCYMMGAFLASRLVLRFSIDHLIQTGVLFQLIAGGILACAPSKIPFLLALVLFNLGIGFILPLTASSALAPFIGKSVGMASSVLGLSYRFIGSVVSSCICLLPLWGGRTLGLALITLSLLSYGVFFWYPSGAQEELEALK